MSKRTKLREIAESRGYSPEKYKRLESLAEKYGFVPPKKDGVLTEAGQAAMDAGTNVIRGFGSTAEEMGITWGDDLREYMDDVRDRNQQWLADPEYKATSLNPADLSRTISSGVTQSGLALGAGVATTALTGGNALAGGAVTTSLVFAQTYGDEVKDFKKVMPMQDEHTVKSLAFFSALGQGLIESVAGPEAIASGIAKKIVTGALKQTVKQYGKKRFMQVVWTMGKEGLKGGLGEGAEEVFQGMISDIAKQAGGANIPFMTLDDAIEQFAGGFLPGMFMSGAAGIVEAKNQGENESNPDDTPDLLAQATTKNNDTPQAGTETNTQEENKQDQTAQEYNETQIKSFKKHWEKSNELPTGQLAESLKRLTNNEEVDNNSFALVKPKSRLTKALAEVSRELTGQEPVYFLPNTPEAGAANGFIGKDNQLFINVETMANNPGVTTGHEFGHFLSRTDKSTYQDFQRVLVDNLKNNHSEYLESLLKTYESKGIDLNQEQAMEEFTNDVIGDFFVDGKFWNEVFSSKTEPGKLKKLAQAIIRFVDTITGKLKGINGTEKYLSGLDKVRSEAALIVREKLEMVESNEDLNNAYKAIEQNTTTDYSGKMPNIDAIEKEIQKDPKQPKENKYMTMPIDIVKKHADHGVSLAKVALEARQEDLARFVDEQIAKEAREAKEKSTKPETENPAPPKQTQTKKVQKEPGNKIEDFGEKIHGARKDVWAQGINLNFDEIRDRKDLTLNKVFPKPDYKKMAADGYSPKQLAYIFITRNNVKKSLNGSRRYSADFAINSIKPFLEKIKDFNTDTDIDTLIADDEVMRNKIDLISAVGIDNVPADIMKYNLFLDDPKRIIIAKGNYIISPDFTSKGSALNWLKERFVQKKEKAKRAKVKLEVFYNRKTKEYLIAKKNGARKYIYVKDGFESAVEAANYLGSNRAELEDQYRELVKIPEERRASNRERVGKDHTNGKDIAPDTFKKAFGFRGVQFGNWVENQRRQQDLNEAYNALVDLANILNIPTEAISLNGELGLAFGARGNSKALAHYENRQTVINLTKKRGAGSLAHEWFHALDNYFGKQLGFSTWLTDRTTPKRNRTGEFDHGNIRPEVLEKANELMKIIERSEVKGRSATLDKYRTKDYWGTLIELSARCFESYVIDRLDAQGVQNDYLANITPVEEYNRKEVYPYPLIEDKEKINNAFDELFKTLKTKETEKGTALYSLNMVRARQANPGLSPEVQSLNEKIQDGYDPGVRTHKSLDKKADETIEQYGEEKLLENLASGHLVLNTDENMRLGLKLLNSDRMIEMIRKGNVTAADAMEQWVKQGTEAGRLLVARKTKSNNPLDVMSILKGLLFAPSKKYRSEKDPAKKRQILKTHERKLINKALNNLKKMDVDFFALNDEQLADVKLVSKIAREIQIAKSDFGDKAYEWWINGLLSLPRTHMANIVGNTAMSATELVPQRFVEAAVNLISKNKKAASFGEFKYMWKAMRENAKNAMRDAGEAFKTGMPVHDAIQKLESANAAIGGKTGEVVRLPGRFLLAADEFAKSIIIPVEASAYAYRTAKAEGLKGNALKERMQELTSDNTGEATEWAVKRAEELTFQAKPWAFIEHLVAAKNTPGFTGRFLSYMFPFVRTPSNILTTTFRKSPLGSAALFARLVTGKMKVTDEKFIRHTAEQLIAWGALVAVSSLMGDDDELPFITGSKGRYGTGEYRWKQRNLPNTSIRIGDRWYDYSRIEPFGSALAMMIDGLESMNMVNKGADGSRVMGKLLESVVATNLRDKSFLQSVGDVLKASEDTKHTAITATNFVSSWIPNVIRGTLSALDDNVPDRRGYSRGMNWFKEQFTAGIIGRAGFSAVPRVDLWGNKISKDDIEGTISPLLFRIVSPIRTRNTKMHRPDQLLFNWNTQNVNEEYWPRVPSPRYTRLHKSLYMNSDLYHKYAKRAGELAYDKVEELIDVGRLDYQKPTASDIKLLKKVFRKARQQAKRELLK